MHVLIVGGGGTIGSTVAYTLSVSRPSTDITLVDPRRDVVEGHAIDLRHARSHVAHSVGRPSFEGPVGEVDIADPDPALVKETDCIVVTASTPRSDGSTERGGRLTFLERNLEIADDIAAWIRESPPTTVVSVSNPADRIVHRLWKKTGWPRHRFLGYSLSESARIADELARLTDASPRDIYCPILGEHGEHIVPVFSRATVDGEALELSEPKRREVVEYVRNVPYDVLALRGASDSSRWVSGRGIAAIVERLEDGVAESPICLSTPLDGEYGFENVSLSVPVRLGKTGVEEIIEWSLSESERAQLEAAYRSVRESDRD